MRIIKGGFILATCEWLRYLQSFQAEIAAGKLLSVLADVKELVIMALQKSQAPSGSSPILIAPAGWYSNMITGRIETIVSFAPRIASFFGSLNIHLDYIYPFDGGPWLKHCPAILY